MYTMGMKGTKWKLFKASVNLIAEKGFEAVSVREIANAVNILPGSIYSHFESKEEILETIYEYYISAADAVFSNSKDQKALKNYSFDQILNYFELIDDYDTSFFEIYYKIIYISVSRMKIDKAAENIIRNYFYDDIKKTLTPVLKRLISEGQIKTIPIDSFLELYITLCLGIFTRNTQDTAITGNEWDHIKLLLIDSIQNDNAGLNDETTS